MGDRNHFSSITSPLERAGESERHLVGVVLDDRRAGVLADIERLIPGEPAGYGPLDLTPAM
jgi:hypothetical protein